MKDRYVTYFKGAFVFLLMLLIVVGFSFGVSFSNFVYKTDNHRAVEMYINELKYNIVLNNNVTNKYTLKPGNNLIDVRIDSLNNIDTNYKLVIDSDLDSYYYDSTKENVLKKKDSISYKVVIFNNTNQNKEVSFKVIGGYITNRIEDVKVSSEYYEINNNISTFEDITYNDNNYKLLGINEDGSIELIGEVIENNLSFEGASGYNDSVNTINDSISSVYSSGGIIEARNLNLNDILKYNNKDVVKYTILSPHKREEDIYIPSSLSSISSENDYTTITIINAPKIDINNDLLNDIFIANKPYYLSTNYVEYNNEKVEYGIFEINNGIKKLKLYDWDNKTYEAESNTRVFIKLSNMINIKDID